MRWLRKNRAVGTQRSPMGVIVYLGTKASSVIGLTMDGDKLVERAALNAIWVDEIGAAVDCLVE